jgi:beta-1,4-mannooligosaccharide/beta-1,4-mannosyl-N-acetylglucosamine phosphorylase
MKTGSKIKLINAENVPNIPWEERSKNCSDVVWRYSRNPIIPRDAIPCSNSIFNSAVVPFGKGFAGVFRCDSKAREMRIHSGFSNDGLSWKISHDTIKFINEDSDPDVGRSDYAYDPRVCKIDDTYYITWCNGYNGPTIGVGRTGDFKKFYKMENAFIPFNRNGVLFPRKIGGKYMMLSRPSDNGHTPFGDIFLSQSPDMVHWGCHRFVMGRTRGWQNTKIGAGPTPIETSEGWLLIYHGVLTSCNGFVYSFGAALLDLEKPWKVIRRAKSYLLSPQKDYECVGDVPNVVFPCASLVDGKTGRIAIYYGAADTCTGLAFTHIDEIMEFVQKEC